MKLLLVLLALAAGVWLWRSGRPAAQPLRRPGPAKASSQAMVPCRHCGVHVPQNEAIAGAQGVYCSAAHRQSAEP